MNASRLRPLFAALVALTVFRCAGQTLPGLPLAQPPQPNATISADYTHYEEGAHRWIAVGHVRFTFRQYVLTGDAGDYDEETGDATLRGSVTLDTGRQTVSAGLGGTLTFNAKTRAWNVDRASTDVLPTGALAPFHAWAEDIAGTRREITLHGAHITSCEPNRPQYEIVAREATIYPGRRIIARHATAYLFGRRLLTVPTIVLPVRQREGERPPLVPVLGQSTEEGVYLKTSLNYARGPDRVGAVKVDLMQKLGLGLGITHEYAPEGKGEVSLYTVTGRAGRNLTANLHDRRSLLGFSVQTDGELRRNSYLYVPDTTSRSGGVALTRAVGAADTQISLHYSGTSATGSRFQTTTASFGQAYRFSRRGTIQLGLDNSRQSSSTSAVAGSPEPTGFSSSELDRKVDVTQGFNAVDVELAANDISTHGGGETAGLFLPVQRLPQLTLRTDAHRLGLTPSKSAPVTLLVSKGSLEANGVRGGRNLLEATAPQRRWKAGSLSLTVGGGFRQAVYSSNSALYAVNGYLGMKQPIGRKSDITLSYSVNAPKGYTPFRYDRPFAYNSLSATGRLADIRGLELRAGTAYDFRNHFTPWRDLLGMVLFQPSPGVRWVTNAAVNINGKAPGETSKVRYVNSGLRLRLGRFHFDGEARYLPSTGRFGRLLGNLDTPLGRDWRVRALAGVDSGQHYQHLLVARDLGCLEASVGLVNDRGWRNETGIRVLLRIKAFPIADPFTTGMFGENLNIGGGDLAGPTAGLPPGI